MNIGENIKRYRLKKGMTQEQLANAVGVSNQAVSKWECDGSIPDGLLLAPIADALGITIDSIFGRDTSYERDVYSAIISLLSKTPTENRMEKAREICWQTQKGLFQPFTKFDSSDYEYNPNELSNEDCSSYVLSDTGFTSISLRKELQFFSLFTQPQPEGWDVLKQYAERFRQLFEALGDEYVINAFFALYAKPNGYIFEKDVLARECNIPDDRIDDVMDKLSFVATPGEIAVNGETRVVYTTNQRHELVAALAIITEFFYGNSDGHRYWLQAHGRNVPYFS